MAIPKRITESRWLVSRIDPELIDVDLKLQRDYWKTLDIDKLGDIKDLDLTKVKVKPLLAQYGNLNSDDRSAMDDWLIFSFHVEEISDPIYKLEFEGIGDNKYISADIRNQFPESFIKDIADMICQLANGDGVRIPFAIPLGLGDTLRHYRLHRAK